MKYRDDILGPLQKSGVKQYKLSDAVKEKITSRRLADILIGKEKATKEENQILKEAVDRLVEESKL